MTFEIQQILKSKETMRRRLAALPLVEKMKLLDTLRERSVAIAASRALRQEREIRRDSRETGGC
jgi:hypothetical protein